MFMEWDTKRTELFSSLVKVPNDQTYDFFRNYIHYHIEI